MLKWDYSGRVIVLLALIQISTLGFLLWNETRHYQDNLLQLQQAHIREQCELLSDTLSPYLINNDRSRLLDVLSSLRDDGKVRYAGIYNTRHELLASVGTLPALSQRVVDDFSYRYELDERQAAIEYPITAAGQVLGGLQLGYRVGPRHWLNTIGAANASVAALGGVLTLLLFAVTFWPLERRLKRLEHAVHELRDGADEVTIYSSDPVGRVASAINSLVIMLRNRQYQLRAKHDEQQQTSQRLSTLLQDLHAVVWEADPDRGCFSYVSDEAEAMLGHPRKNWLDSEFIDHMIHPSDQTWLREYFHKPSPDHDSFAMELRALNTAQEWRWLRMIGSIEIRTQGPIAVGLLLDVSTEKQNEQHIAYLADHDELTGLINRRRFQERLQDRINFGHSDNDGLALMMVDLERCQFINATFGREAGDQYLRKSIEHIQVALNNEMVVGRLGGDAFGVLLPSADAVLIHQTSTRIFAQLNGQTFNFGNHSVPFTANIGVALYPKHGTSASELLNKADIAVDAAYEQGPNTSHVFIKGRDDNELRKTMQWEQRIRQALKDNAFALFFQPIVNVQTGAIQSYEVLLRLAADGTYIAASHFMPSAESFELAEEIDRWVIMHAVRAWRSNVASVDLTLNINLSGRQLTNLEILEMIHKTLRYYRVDARTITFEMNAGDVVKNPAMARRFIDALHDRGHRFALDNFGEGIISLTDLRDIPADFIKIDSSLMEDLYWNPFNRAVLKAISEVAGTLQIPLVAQAVDDERNIEFLRGFAVPLAQGDLFAPPAPRFHELEKVVIKDSA